MSTKRMEAMRKKFADAAVRVDDRQAAEGDPPERLDVPATAMQAQQINQGVYAQLDANRAENERLREKLASITSSGAPQQVDPDLVDVPGFNRLIASLDPASDPDFARFCESIRVFGGNKQPAMVRPSPASPGRFDLVFADPPYDIPEAEVAAMLLALCAHGWLAAGALVVLERSSRSPETSWPEQIADVQIRRYGETRLEIGRVA